MEQIAKTAIIGGCGGFGRAFARLLQQSGVEVTTVDVVAGADYVCDLASQPEIAAAMLAEQHLVLLCLAEAQALAVLAALDELLPAGALVADICSVKSPIVAHAQRFCQQCEYVSLHPMFGPERNFADNNMVFIPVRSGSRAAALRTWLAGQCQRVTDTDADSHDRVTSLVQVATHAVLASFANLQARLAIDPELVAAFATPVFRDLEKVSQDLVGSDPQLYHNIQTSNPHGAAAREALAQAVQQTLGILADTDGADMARLFNDVAR